VSVSSLSPRSSLALAGKAVLATVAVALVLATGAPAMAATGPHGHVGGPVATADQALGARVVAEAARHLGAPYVYGATGPQAFDCSGFVQYVYARLGVSLPRTAAQQYDAVRHISNADKQPGDLVFFRLGGGGIDHVGIYAGNDQVIVAPKAGDHVRYQTIWTSYQVGRVG
jgi:peptidoglycan DL-endopeptidase CwlO